MQHDEGMVKTHIEKLAALESSTKSAHYRLDTLEDKIDAIENKQDIMHEMNTNIKLIAQNQDNQGKEIVTIKTDLKDLKEKPAKRWDLVGTVAITAVASGLVGYVLSMALGGG